MDTLSAKLKKGIRKPDRAAVYCMNSVLQTVGKYANYGLRPYNREWDVFICIDACRYDLFEYVVEDHPVNEYISEYEPVYSCATATPEWLDKSFNQAPDEKVNQTAVIAGNGHADKVCDTERFGHYEPVWLYEHEDYFTVTPDIVTNQAIRVYRERNPEYLVVHYIQPHAPFLHCTGKYREIEENRKDQVWTELRHGNVSKDVVWEDYAKNLEIVLDDVQTLIENLGGKIVVTSDHGNGMGELGVYGHRLYSVQPSLKRVPWAVATGRNEDAYEVKEVEEFSCYDQTSLDDHLRNLGYKT